jgi:glycerol kinase
MSDLGQAPPTPEEMYRLLDRLGLAADDALSFAPHLNGERHDISLTGQLCGLRLTNGSLGQIARAVARGIVANARSLMPKAAMEGRTRIVASGNAMRRSELLRCMAEIEFGLPINISNYSEEAATGAAFVAQHACAG